LIRGLEKPVFGESGGEALNALECDAQGRACRW
jgi:hypothetical protein